MGYVGDLGAGIGGAGEVFGIRCGGGDGVAETFGYALANGALAAAGGDDFVALSSTKSAEVGSYSVKVDQPLNLDPNVGGFGQEETEIVLQKPARIIGYLAFCFCVLLTQVFLIIKKKQFEKVQAAELNF